MIIAMRNLHSHHQGDLAESWHVQIFLQHFCWIFSIWHPGEYLLISRWIFACPGEFQEIYLASSSHFQDCEMKWASWTYDGYSVSVKHVCSFDALNECYRSNICIWFFGFAILASLVVSNYERFSLVSCSYCQKCGDWGKILPFVLWRGPADRLLAYSINFGFQESERDHYIKHWQCQSDMLDWKLVIQLSADRLLAYSTIFGVQKSDGLRCAQW